MILDNISSASASVASRASAPAASGTDSAAGNFSDPNLFIKLLTTQLQAQDPLNPMSAQDMVAQLTQVSSLQQLVSINQVLKDMSGAGATAPVSGQNSTSKT